MKANQKASISPELKRKWPLISKGLLLMGCTFK